MSRLKEIIKKYQDQIILTIGVILISLISFGAGRLSVERVKEPVNIKEPNLAVISQLETEPQTSEEEEKERMFMGSIKSDKYHLPDCSWAERILPANQIWFKSVKEAEAQGYQPANCVTRQNQP
ncbi:MAG TPA: hypothetical protein ENI16_00970 [Candidatus Portnoybacteria bacterium]|nr:hypothetical protein [Candidatus Portnoybacteria bacterium]